MVFTKGKPTKKLWYYQLNVERNMGKTNPLNENDLEDFVKIAKAQKPSNNSWSVDINEINKDTFELSVSNPNTVEVVDKRTPKEIIDEIEVLETKTAKALKSIKELL